MLHEFLTDNSHELVERCRIKVAMRRAPRATPTELSHGIPLFLSQLTEIFPQSGDWNQDPREDSQDNGFLMTQTAEKHGRELLEHDFTIEQVVHDYGDLCQAITELAAERKAPITVKEFGCLNSTLDNAIASAVASYSAQHETTFEGESRSAAKAQLGTLANAMRNQLNTAILAASAMKRGSVGRTGATAAALDRSLIAMRGLIDRSLAEVRLEANSAEVAEVIEIGPFIAAVQLAAVLEASSTQCELTVVVQPDIFVRGDRHLLASAVANLLHGAVASTKRDGEVFLNARSREGRVIIEVEDNCSCHTKAQLDDMVERFEKRGAPASTLGSALAAARRAVEANTGRLTLEVVGARGCVYTIDLPAVR